VLYKLTLKRCREMELEKIALAVDSVWVMLAGVAVYVAVISYVILTVLRATIGLRVTEEEEVMGLDMSEHGLYGYPEQLSSSFAAVQKGN
jgi:ammonia channel protein AmtB